MNHEDKIIHTALQILRARANKGAVMGSPEAAGTFLQLHLAEQQREIFAVLFLDAQHALIEYRELFAGTVDAASVYPREVVKQALELNAVAVILGHNHPSNTMEPSMADIAITKRIKEALALVDIRVLDHVIVSLLGHLSMAERGLI